MEYFFRVYYIWKILKDLKERCRINIVIFIEMSSQKYFRIYYFLGINLLYKDSKKYYN